MNAERGPITAKFGGSSLADAARIRRVAEIVEGNPERRYVVVSAPGKRHPDDQKITDLLYRVYHLQENGKNYEHPLSEVTGRYEGIGKELTFYHTIVDWLEVVERGIRDEKGLDWTVSRGEWLMAQILAHVINGKFHDADSLIKLNSNKHVNDTSYDLIRKILLSEDTICHVIPGFYGSTPSGVIKIFTRGGSDITGAIIAKGTESSVYENWSDVPGVLAADPKIVENPRIIPSLSFQQMRELGDRGAEVLHPNAVIPAAEAHIPIHVRSTFSPEELGTWIGKETGEQPAIIGIAGKTGFTAFHIEEVGLNERPGIGEATLRIFSENGVAFEHMPTSIDAFSVIVKRDHLDGNEHYIISALNKLFPQGTVSVERNLGLVCVVGKGIKDDPTSVHAELYAAMKKEGIAVKKAVYSGQESTIIGVSGEDVTHTIQTLYNTFIEPEQC